MSNELGGDLWRNEGGTSLPVFPANQAVSLRLAPQVIWIEVLSLDELSVDLVCF